MSCCFSPHLQLALRPTSDHIHWHAGPDVSSPIDSPYFIQKSKCATRSSGLIKSSHTSILLGIPALPAFEAGMVDDPFHISQVSGFYGPGTWASWVIALASSSISVMGGDTGVGYDVIVHILYTQLAAIDLFRQLNRDDLSFGPLLAALVITFWGYAYNIVHFFLNAKPEGGKFGPAMLFGSILPCIALVTFTVHGYRTPESLRTDLFAGTSLSQEDASALLSSVNWLMIFTFGLVGFSLAYAAVWICMDFKRGYSLFFLIFMIIPVVGIIYVNLIGYFLVFVAVQFTWKEIPDCHFLKPCAPQSISEWDQAFALMCALIIFAYEKGPMLLEFARRRKSPHDSS